MISNKLIGILVIVIILLLQDNNNNMVEAQLTPTFYSKSCPILHRIVRLEVGAAVTREPRMGASILRLFFHDCFVNGCDGSILLDDTSSFTGEKSANPNRNSARGFGLIDKIKLAVENACPGVVSCADVLTIAARDSVVALGGKAWVLALGRRDAITANLTAANSNIPAPTSSLSQLISSFNDVGLSTRDMVALSGAHTIGVSRCTNFRTRIYNETHINRGFAAQQQTLCPERSGSGDENLAPLDAFTPRQFDNNYFKNLVTQRGLLHSDQELFNGGSTDSIVTDYSRNMILFFSDFATAMTKMSLIRPLTGSEGEIRKVCGRIN